MPTSTESVIGDPTEREDYGAAVLAGRLCAALLPELMSGELRVKDAERFIISSSRNGLSMVYLVLTKETNDHAQAYS